MYSKPMTPVALPPLAPPAEKVLRRPPRRMVGPPTRMPQAYPTPLGILRAPTAGSGWQSLSDAMLDYGASMPRPSTSEGGPSAGERFFGHRSGTAASEATTFGEDAPMQFRLVHTPRIAMPPSMPAPPPTAKEPPRRIMDPELTASHAAARAPQFPALSRAGTTDPGQRTRTKSRGQTREGAAAPPLTARPTVRPPADGPPAERNNKLRFPEAWM